MFSDRQPPRERKKTYRYQVSNMALLQVRAMLEGKEEKTHDVGSVLVVLKLRSGELPHVLSCRHVRDRRRAAQNISP